MAEGTIAEGVCNFDGKRSPGYLVGARRGLGGRYHVPEAPLIS